MDLSNQQTLDGGPKVIKQINFTANLDGAVDKAMFVIYEEVEKTVLDFPQGSVRVLLTYNHKS